MRKTIGSKARAAAAGSQSSSTATENAGPQLPAPPPAAKAVFSGVRICVSLHDPLEVSE